MGFTLTNFAYFYHCQHNCTCFFLFTNEPYNRGTCFKNMGDTSLNTYILGNTIGKSSTINIVKLKRIEREKESSIFCCITCHQSLQSKTIISNHLLLSSMVRGVGEFYKAIRTWGPYAAMRLNQQGVIIA